MTVNKQIPCSDVYVFVTALAVVIQLKAKTTNI